MKIYLDVDGVILTKDRKQMDGLEVFLKTLYSLFPDDIYWLTTHCKEDDTSRVLGHLKGLLDDDLYEILETVKPTTWYELKTEAIDFNDDFYWFDDCVFLAEQNVLKERGVFDSWIKVENNLENITKFLQK
jgi:hypothetical protein